MKRVRERRKKRSGSWPRQDEAHRLEKMGGPAFHSRLLKDTLIGKERNGMVIARAPSNDRRKEKKKKKKEGEEKREM